MTTSWRPTDIEWNSAIERRTIPFDYAFRFQLSGEKNSVHVQTLTVSIEAPFTAQSVGYGVIPHRPPIRFGPTPQEIVPPVGGLSIPTPRPRGPVELGYVSVPAIRRALERALRVSTPGGTSRQPRGLQRGLDVKEVFTRGFRIAPDRLQQFLLADDSTPLDRDFLETLFEEVMPVPEEIQFLYALFDEGTGRAFQSDPILNIASLGIADGDRPFRYFAVPITFEARSTIRMEITEVSEYPGDLHVSLHGYRTLGGAGTPTGRAHRHGARL